MNAITLTRKERTFLGFCNNPKEYVTQALGGNEVFGFIGGEFSLIDAISACVDQVPDCQLTVSTWTAAKADMQHVLELMRDGRIRAAKWIVDRSFQNRQPELCQFLRDRFGDDAIRVQRVHCKFALVQNENTRMTVQTSANLNRNQRLENLSVSTCPVLFDAYQDLVVRMFDIQPPAEGFEDSSSPTRAFKQLVLGDETWIEKKVRQRQAKFDRKVKRLEKPNRRT